MMYREIFSDLKMLWSEFIQSKTCNAATMNAQITQTNWISKLQSQVSHMDGNFHFY